MKICTVPYFLSQKHYLHENDLAKMWIFKVKK